MKTAEKCELDLDPEWDFVLNKNFISRVSEENEDQDSSSGKIILTNPIDEQPVEQIKKNEGNFNQRKTSWHKKREIKYKMTEQPISFTKDKKGGRREANSVLLLSTNTL